MAAPSSGIQGYVTQNPPRHPRAAALSNMVFQPGVASNNSARSLQGRWKDSNRVRWHAGAPEKIQGWAVVPLTGANAGVYIGTARGNCDWASLDTQQWIALGTECKLYLINNSVLYDITPLRKTSNISNPFTTTNASATVRVTDLDHRANSGDHISIIGASAVGGITLAGDYTIVSIIDPDSYTVLAASAASSGATGGGSVSIEYDINCGLAQNGELLGYGTFQYGEELYGTPRAAGEGIPAKMRIWSLSNWGEDLVASYNDGPIYWWQRSSGPNSRAVLLDDPAPNSVQRILVNPDTQFIIAIGASDVTGDADNMNVRWASEGSLTDWFPTTLPVANTAGGQRLNYGARMITGINSRQQNLLWSDTQLYQMQSIGLPNIFGFKELGKCSIAGPNAAIDVNGIVLFMGFDDFYIYDGTLRPIPCDVWEYIFGVMTPTGRTAGDFDRTQAEATYCASLQTKSEVTWWYPTVADGMHYVTYNYTDACWYYGKMARTAMHDVSAALSGFFENPYGFNGGHLYLHETGTDEVEPAGVTNAMDYFMESWDIGSQSDVPVLINAIIPDFPRLRGQLQLFKGLQFRILPREYPNQAQGALHGDAGPFVVTPSTTQKDVRCKGTQTALRIEAARATWTDGGGTHTNAIVYGQWFRLGTWQSLATAYGKRIDQSNPGAAIDTSGP